MKKEKQPDVIKKKYTVKRRVREKCENGEKRIYRLFQVAVTP